jgi:hypothetical protein
MDFEFDPARSLANKDKHGLDFEEAQAIWRDDDRLEVSARLVGESRFLTIGRIGQKLWTAVWTWRGPKVRLISARRARDAEVENYVRQQTDHD